MSSTDHKVIGYMYLITSFVFFAASAASWRWSCAPSWPSRACRSSADEQFNQLFTMHGTIMLLLFATPLFVGFANVIMPLQIGSPDVAFPRMNMLSFCLFLFGGLITISGFLTPGGAASFGWYAYSPLSNAIRSPERRRRPVDHGSGAVRPRHDPRWRQLHHHDLLHAGAGHDDVPDADLHLEHPAHRRSWC